MKKPSLGKRVSEPKTATAPSLTDTGTGSDAGAAAAAAAASPTDAKSLADAASVSVPRDVTARGLHSECVVCQDAEVIAHLLFLQCFDAVGWAAGRASGL